jgi:hypothetical protein
MPETALETAPETAPENALAIVLALLPRRSAERAIAWTGSSRESLHGRMTALTCLSPFTGVVSAVCSIAIGKTCQHFTASTFVTLASPILSVAPDPN